jgi:hypothetical protein
MKKEWDEAIRIKMRDEDRADNTEEIRVEEEQGQEKSGRNTFIT